MVLSDLKQGQPATIQDWSILNDAVKKRLTDFGIHIGSNICVKSEMPFNGPCIIESKGLRFAIRKRDASCIKVVSK